ncbi:hypothetical protein ACFX2B_023230 [Malus domestica]
MSATFVGSVTYMSRLSKLEMRIILIQLIFGALVLLSLSVVLENSHLQLMKDPSISCCRSWLVHHLHLQNTNFQQSSARLLKPACKRMQMARPTAKQVILLATDFNLGDGSLTSTLFN